MELTIFDVQRLEQKFHALSESAKDAAAVFDILTAYARNWLDGELSTLTSRQRKVYDHDRKIGRYVLDALSHAARTRK